MSSGVYRPSGNGELSDGGGGDDGEALPMKRSETSEVLNLTLHQVNM
jgi:hypothetical protein